MYFFLSITGIIIIAVLSIIAWRMQAKVNQMNLKRQAQQKEIDDLQLKHKTYLNDSIQILAQGIIDEQLTLTEGAIRISVLLDNLSLNDELRESYSAFFQLADTLAHIPILKAWKALPKAEKLRYEKERLAAEVTYKEFVLDAAQRIRGDYF